jgi:hypothetical protein
LERRTKLNDILDNSSTEEVIKPNLELDGIRHLTGNNLNFINEANAVMNEVKSFNKQIKEGLPADETTKKEMYTIINERMIFLSENNPVYYEDLLKSERLNSRIIEFKSLKSVL